jgi:hypothetical protein
MDPDLAHLCMLASFGSSALYGRPDRTALVRYWQIKPTRTIFRFLHADPRRLFPVALSPGQWIAREERSATRFELCFCRNFDEIAPLRC